MVSERTHASSKGQPTSHAPAPSGGQGAARATQLKRDLSGRSYDEQVQLLAPDGGGSAAIQQEAAAGVRGSGGALPHLDAIQHSFGRHDVSTVQAYSGGQAAAATEAMGAAAYASGEKVAFGGAADLHTAAHEAAHVVQQRAGVSLDGGVGKSGDRYEQHAEAVASKVVQGESAEGLLDQFSGGEAAAEGNVQGFLGFGEEDEEESESGSGGGGGGFAGAAADAWQGAKDTASNAWEGAKEGASEAWEGAKEGASEAWEGAKEGAGEAWEGVKQGGEAIVEGVESGVEAVKDAAHGAWDGIREAGGAAWDAVKQAGGDAFELMRKYGAKTLEELKDILLKLPGMAANATTADTSSLPSILGMSGKLVIPGVPCFKHEAPWGEISAATPAWELVYKVVKDPEAKRGWKLLWWKSDDPAPADGGDAPAPAPAPAKGGKTEVTAGRQDEGALKGVQLEIKRELEDKFMGAKASVKGGGEATAGVEGKKGKFGVGLELEWEDVMGTGTSVTLGGEFSILKWEPGGKPQIGVFTASGAAKVATIEHAFTSPTLAGGKAALEGTVKFEVDINPNELWFAEKLAAAAASLGVVPIALIVGGMLSVGIPLVQIANMENVIDGRDRAFKVGADVRRYGLDYVNALKGQASGSAGGSAAAQWLAQLSSAQGPDAVAKFVNEMNPSSTYTQAASQAWPKLKQQAIDAYWSAHPWEKVASLGGLMESPGSKTLRMFLNDIEPSVMKY